MKFKDLKLWQRKLEYVTQKRDDILNFNQSWFEHDQKIRYAEMVAEAERRVREYQNLIDYLKEVEE